MGSQQSTLNSIISDDRERPSILWYGKTYSFRKLVEDRSIVHNPIIQVADHEILFSWTEESIAYYMSSGRVVAKDKPPIQEGVHYLRQQVWPYSIYTDMEHRVLIIYDRRAPGQWFNPLQ